MRTFHTGGVAGADITHGLPRVVEIFEARNPKGAATLAETAGGSSVEDTDRGPKVTVVSAGTDGKDEPIEQGAYQFPRRTRLLVSRRATWSSRATPSTMARVNPADLLQAQGLHRDRALPRRRGAEGLQVAGRRHPRQAHRADRPADDEEGAGRHPGRHGSPARSAGRPDRARARERSDEGRGRRGGDVRAADPRHHQGVARDRVVPLGRLLPGDDEGPDRRRDRGQGRPAARPEGERHHRQADPGRDGTAGSTGRSRSARPRRLPVAAYTRPETEEQLLAALEEIGADGGDLAPSTSTSAGPIRKRRTTCSSRSRRRRSPRSTRPLDEEA